MVHFFSAAEETVFCILYLLVVSAKLKRAFCVSILRIYFYTLQIVRTFAVSIESKRRKRAPRQELKLNAPGVEAKREASLGQTLPTTKLTIIN